MDSGCTGANVTWCDPESMTWKTYLSTNKELFDTELYIIEEALEIALRGGQTEHKSSRQQTELPWTKIHILADSQRAIKWLRNTNPGSGQSLARCTYPYKTPPAEETGSGGGGPLDIRKHGHRGKRKGRRDSQGGDRESRLTKVPRTVRLTHPCEMHGLRKN